MAPGQFQGCARIRHRARLGVVELADECARVLREEAGSYARAAMASLRREFPASVRHTMTSPGDFPYRPRARTPVFYGSLDWPSSVQAHWMLVRLLRVAADAGPAREIRTLLGARLDRVALAVEEEFVRGPDGVGERPFGWGWVLALARETSGWDDPDGGKWAAALAPLAAAVGALFLSWLSGAAHPVRHGTRANSAFGLSLALPYATARAGAGDPALLEAITGRAYAWFGSDILYPASLEPSGGDVLSPALAEAGLMARVLPPDDFAEWLGVFLPGIEHGQPASLSAPVPAPAGPGPADGPGAADGPVAAGGPVAADSDAAGRHALNASRAWCWRRLAETLPDGDRRIAAAAAAARAHAGAVLPHVVAAGAADWLPAYAVLMLG